MITPANRPGPGPHPAVAAIGVALILLSCGPANVRGVATGLPSPTWDRRGQPETAAAATATRAALVPLAGYGWKRDHHATLLGLGVALDPGWPVAIEFVAEAAALIGEEAVFLSRLEPVSTTSRLAVALRWLPSRSWPVLFFVDVALGGEPGIGILAAPGIGLRLPWSYRFGLDLRVSVDLALGDAPLVPGVLVMLDGYLSFGKGQE